MDHALMALSPLDGRYADKTKTLRGYFSEYGLIRARITTMIEWVLALTRGGLTHRLLTEKEQEFLCSLYGKFNLRDAEDIKRIETIGREPHARTNHDVKACELWLRDHFEKSSLADFSEWIHFGLTSEDVNNVAYAFMLSGAIDEVIRPNIDVSVFALNDFAKKYAALPMLARTHGQPASPTTLGKECKVFSSRLSRQERRLAEFALQVKTNGASGNFNALALAFPEVIWTEFVARYIERINDTHDRNFVVNPVTTQIEPHDTYAELFDILRLVNTIVIDACQDFWRYVSDDWLVQVPVAGETGSSAMPHKVNPIDAENALGNARMAIALCEVFARTLPISFLQRDLSDSTVERNFGSAFGHTLLALTSLVRFLGKVAPNEEKIVAVLREHPEVITEAYQTLLRKAGFSNAYMTLKDFARGKKLTLNSLHHFVRGLEIPESLKDELISITPENYIGLAPSIVTDN